MGYSRTRSDSACCDSNGNAVETCQCRELDVSLCKELCDRDDNCRGYVDTSRNQCELATTSDCPNPCEKYKGSNATIDQNKKCGNGYRGCFTKGEELKAQYHNSLSMNINFIQLTCCILRLIKLIIF